MEKKLVYMTYAIIGIVIFPVKLFMNCLNPSSVKSLWFMLIYAFSVFVMMVVSSKSKAMKDEKPIPKNPVLSVLSVLCSIGCAWSAYMYFSSEKPKDLKVQYTMLSIFCAISALFFVYVCYAHMSGKNPFKNLQMLLFAAPLMYLFALSVFFSYEIGKHDVYNVLAKSLTLLFFIYYVQNYISLPDIGYKRKRMITFGLPASLVSFGYFFSNLNLFSFFSLESVSSLMHFFISCYIMAFLVSGPVKSVEERELANA